MWADSTPSPYYSRGAPQFILAVHPVALGQGLPLFSELTAPLRLELVSSRSFPGGAMAQAYRPA